MIPRRSRKLAARIWWATLPYYGWTDGYPNPDNPAPWYAYPLSWLNRLVNRLPSDYCLGLTDEWTP